MANRHRTADTPNLAAQGQSVSRKTVAEVPLTGLSSGGLNFTLDTAAGPIDFLGEVAGGGPYEALILDAVELHVFGVTCQVVALERLISLKRAAGRPKDYEAIAELESLREERGTG